MPATCTCEIAAAHIIARRQTADGIGVVVWSDGAITGRLGSALSGVPVVRPRSADAVATSRAVGWMFADEVCLYDADEAGALLDACRWAVTRGLSVTGARRRFADAARPTVRPVWQVIATDRDGNPRERVWRLPRLRWPGLAVFDIGSAAHRYQVWTVDRKDVCEPTGVHFATLGEIAGYLHSLL